MRTLTAGGSQSSLSSTLHSGIVSNPRLSTGLSSSSPTTPALVWEWPSILHGKPSLKTKSRCQLDYSEVGSSYPSSLTSFKLQSHESYIWLLRLHPLPPHSHMLFLFQDSWSLSLLWPLPIILHWGQSGQQSTGSANQLSVQIFLYPRKKPGFLGPFVRFWTWPIFSLAKAPGSHTGALQ